VSLLRHWGRRLRRSLGMRLVLLFLLLALATTAIFLAGMQRVLQGGCTASAWPPLSSLRCRTWATSARR
jgi:hypothetical protein